MARPCRFRSRQARVGCRAKRGSRRRAHGVLVVLPLLVAGGDALAFLQAALDQLLQRRGAHLVAAHDRVGALDLHRGMAAIALLLLDRLASGAR